MSNSKKRKNKGRHFGEQQSQKYRKAMKTIYTVKQPHVHINPDKLSELSELSVQTLSSSHTDGLVQNTDSNKNVASELPKLIDILDDVYKSAFSNDDSLTSWVHPEDKVLCEVICDDTDKWPGRERNVVKYYELSSGYLLGINVLKNRITFPFIK